METPTDVDEDDLRAAYELLCSEFWRSKVPLQSRVCANRLFHSQERDKELFHLVQENLSSSQQVEVEISPEVIPSEVASEAARYIQKEYSSKLDYEDTFTFCDAIQLADDVDMLLKFSGAHHSSRSSQVKPVVIDPNLSTEGSHSHEMEVPHTRVTRRDVEECSEPPLKRNPFTTAKARYLEEGYKLPQKVNGVETAQLKSGSSKSSGEDTSLIDRIEADIIVRGAEVSFADIAGLEFAKKCVQELICWPMTRPDLFKGLRAVPKGILLFGPPGTGKTLIGKAIAHEIQATFFNISASSLTSKWVGEGEKAVRLLFSIAITRQPSVVFIDEVDSLLSTRTSDENDSTRRIKTEFLVQLDGAGTDASARVICIGATNRPDELDEVLQMNVILIAIN